MQIILLTKDRTKIISLNIGLKQTKKNYINVIPLRGFYTARPGDKVIALVVDKNPVKYRCNINAKEDAILKPKNTMKRGRMKRGGRERYDSGNEKYEIGDILIAKVLSADRLNAPELTTVGKYLGKRNNGIVKAKLNLGKEKIGEFGEKDLVKGKGSQDP